MDAFKLHLRNAARLSSKFAVSIAILCAALVSISLAVPALDQAAGSHATGSNTTGGNSVMSSIRKYLRDPLAYLALRSPGTRGSGPLAQSKHRMFKLANTRKRPPHEQVLSNVRYAPPIPDYLNDLVPNRPLDSILASPFGTGLSRAPAIVNPPIPPVVPVISIPGGGGSGNTGGESSPVPEPGTWLMLIWGMGMVGYGVRAGQYRLANRRTALEQAR